MNLTSCELILNGNEEYSDWYHLVLLPWQIGGHRRCLSIRSANINTVNSSDLTEAPEWSLDPQGSLKHSLRTTQPTFPGHLFVTLPPHSAPAAKAFLPFLEHPELVSASGLLHLLFSLLAMLPPVVYPAGSSFTSGFCLNDISFQDAFLDFPIHKQLHLPQQSLKKFS